MVQLHASQMRFITSPFFPSFPTPFPPIEFADMSAKSVAKYPLLQYIGNSIKQYMNINHSTEDNESGGRDGVKV